MKTTFLILVSLFAMATAPLHAGTDTLLKAVVTGTVQTENVISPTERRIHTTPLDNKRIFAEFQVTKTDYELVVRFGSTYGLFLQPRHLGAGKPTITVVQFGTNLQEVADTRAHVLHFVANTATIPATNLFQDLDGEVAATALYSGPLVPGLPVTKFVFSVTGHGTDQLNVNSSDALLKFKVVGKGTFTSVP